jgi:hypothetical protein
MNIISRNIKFEADRFRKLGGITVDVMSLLDNLGRVHERNQTKIEAEHLNRAKDAALKVASAALGVVLEHLNDEQLHYEFGGQIEGKKIYRIGTHGPFRQAGTPESAKLGSIESL